MSITSWILFAFISWIGGYLQTTLSNPSKVEIHVRVPKLMFFVFGMPKTKHFPRKVMSLRGIWFQVVGIMLIVFRIFLIQRIPKQLQADDFIVGLVFSFATAFLVAILLKVFNKFD